MAVMDAFEPHLTAASATPRRIVRWLASRLGAVYREARRRRALRALKALDRAQLDDIGLTSEDIHLVLEQPFSRDAARIVSARARERQLGEMRVRTGERPGRPVAFPSHKGQHGNMIPKR